MPLEDAIAKLTAAVEANTTALAAIVGKAAAKATDAPGGDKAAEGSGSEPRGRGRPRGSTNKDKESDKPADAPAGGTEAFNAALKEFLNFDDKTFSDQEVEDERDARRTFILNVASVFKVEKAREIPVEHHEKVLEAVKKFADGEDVDPKSVAPASDATPRRRR